MRRQLNFKVAGWLLGLILLLGTGVAVLHSYQVVRHADGLLHLADRALEQNRPEQALRYFSLYLSYRPNDIDAMARYGLTLEKLANGPAERERAIVVLDGVLRREPHRQDVRYRLLISLTQLQRIHETIVQAEKLLPGWPKKGEVEHILGWCYEALNQYDKAAEWFRKAIAADPQRTESYVLLADILQQKQDERDRAAQVMDDLVKANGDSFRAHLLRRRFLLQRPFLSKEEKTAQQARAEKDLLRALELAPREPEVVLAAANSAVSRGKNHEARELLARSIGEHPNLESLYLALAELEVADGKPAAARAVLERGLKNLPQSWDLLVQLTDALIDAHELPRAEQRSAELRRSRPSSPLPDYFQARLHIERRQWTAAVAILERLRDEFLPGSAWALRVHVQLGWCHRRLGDAEQQLIAFSRAVNLDPNLPVALAGRGSALLALGRLDEALQDLEKAAKGPRVPPGTWNDLARCRMLRNLRLPENERNWAVVQNTFEQAARSEPRTVETVVFQAEIEIACKNLGQARKLLDEARAEFPRSTALECARADLALRQQDFAGALAVLDRAEKDLGRSLEIRLARLRLWSWRAAAIGDRTARREVTALGENLELFTAAERARLLRDLAEAWTRLGDTRAAEKFWRRLIDEQPADLRARLSLLELSLQSGKLDAARRLVADFRKIEGDKGAYWHYGAAALLAAEAMNVGQVAATHHAPLTAKLDQARKHLAECHPARSDWGRLLLLEAHIDEMEGKTAQAIGHYKKAFILGERTPGLVYRLVKLLQERRDFAEADNVFRAFEEQGPLLPEMARLGAELALANNNMPRALTLGRLSVPADSRDYRDYLWLARLYQTDARAKAAMGKASEADKIVKLTDKFLNEAARLAPHAPDAWAAMVEHLTQTNRADQVPLVLAEVKKRGPSQRLAFTLARCYEAVGQFDLAERHYREALAQSPGDFVLESAVADFFRRSDQPDKAVPFLEKLIDPARFVPEGLQGQARRQLALILAGKDNKRALALLSVYPPGTYPANDRTRALVLGFDPATRAAAVKAFEELRKREPAAPDELFYLARIFQADADADQARELLSELANAYPGNPQYLAGYAASLLHSGDVNGAWTCLQKLEKREPDSPRTRNLKKAILKASSAP